MEHAEILDLWKTYDRKLEQHLQVNGKSAVDIDKMKAHTFTMSMSVMKLFAIVIGLVWVGAINVVITNLFFTANPIFLISAGLQALITMIAIVIYIYQSVIIHNYDISEPVLKAQKKLASLKSTTLLSTRVLFLQLPFWTTFYWNEEMLNNSSLWVWGIQIAVTITSIYLAIWLFLNISYKNRDKKWFRAIFGKEWDPVLKSIRMLKEIEDYRENELINK